MKYWRVFIILKEWWPEDVSGKPEGWLNRSRKLLVKAKSKDEAAAKGLDWATGLADWAIAAGAKQKDIEVWQIWEIPMREGIIDLDNDEYPVI